MAPTAALMQGAARNGQASAAAPPADQYVQTQPTSYMSRMGVADAEISPVMHGRRGRGQPTIFRLHDAQLRSDSPCALRAPPAARMFCLQGCGMLWLPEACRAAAAWRPALSPCDCSSLLWSLNAEPLHPLPRPGCFRAPPGPAGWMWTRTPRRSMPSGKARCSAR